MAIVHVERREIHCKIVYYGIAMSGKTTNLKHISKHHSREKMDDVHSVNNNPRVTFLELPSIDLVRGYHVYLHLFTTHGVVPSNEIYLRLLQGVDGIVFVVDSLPYKLTENIDISANLIKNFHSQNRSLHDIPFVLQYNKRDVSKPLALNILNEQVNYFNSPSFEAIANRGVGVLETFDDIRKRIVETL